MRNVLEMGEFTSASSAAIVNVCVGFVPDVLFLFVDVAGTNPNQIVAFNASAFSNATDADPILITGASGIYTTPGSGVKAYAGNEDADGTVTYVNANGTAIASGLKTSAGFTVPIASQVNSGKNIWMAFRADR